MNTNTIVGIVAVIIIVIAGWFLFQNTNGLGTGATTTPPLSVSTTTGTGTSTTTPKITYGTSGFSPRTVTIGRGETVTWTNESSGAMWVASASHPTHTAYSSTTLEEHCPDTSGTAFDQCASVQRGGTYSFTFDQLGTWNYHNHSDSSFFGTVVVTE